MSTQSRFPLQPRGRNECVLRIRFAHKQPEGLSIRLLLTGILPESTNSYLWSG